MKMSCNTYGNRLNHQIFRLRIIYLSLCFSQMFSNGFTLYTDRDSRIAFSAGLKAALNQLKKGGCIGVMQPPFFSRFLVL
jgi:hypothetical protein